MKMKGGLIGGAWHFIFLTAGVLVVIYLGLKVPYVKNWIATAITPKA